MLRKYKGQCSTVCAGLSVLEERACDRRYMYSSGFVESGWTKSKTSCMISSMYIFTIHVEKYTHIEQEWGFTFNSYLYLFIYIAISRRLRRIKIISYNIILFLRD